MEINFVESTTIKYQTIHSIRKNLLISKTNKLKLKENRINLQWKGKQEPYDIHL